MCKKIYIGLAITLHDPSIAIIDDKGKILFAEGSERYLQNKRAWNSIPDNIGLISRLVKEFCKDCDEVEISYSWSKSFINLVTIFPKQALFIINNGFVKKNTPSFLTNVIYGMLGVGNMTGYNLKYFLRTINPKARIKERYNNHHLAHAAYACYGSSFDNALCAIIDGFGEGTSAMFFHYNNGKIKKLKSSKLSLASLGGYYWDLCEKCGFDPIKGEEWKVMGLAPYGSYDDNIYKILKQLIRVNKLKLENGSNRKKVLPLFSKMRRSPNESPLKSANLAFTGQKIFSDVMKQLLNNLYNTMKIPNLILSGGCALNSAWNGKIIENTPFKNVYVPSAPADDGNSIGAALLSLAKDHPDYYPSKKIISPYLGASMSTTAIERINKFGGMKNNLKYGENLFKKTAKLIAEGNIIGWVQGKAEFGPRALGNRSILANPGIFDIKEKINASVKFREEFRPFAPAILHEYGNEYFENYQETPYMERALKFKKGVIEKVPGVVHVDYTGRLQTVKKEWNQKFYNLIKEFYNITGIPILLNTSFNIMGKPIIHTVEDAIALFYTTGIDVLVIEDQLFIKKINN
jgi:carbamoyltransferase